MMVAAIIMGLTSAAFSKDFKGIITYKITYPGMEIDPSMAAMMPKMATLTLKDQMSKFVINMGQMGSQSQIMNGEARTVTTLMDMMGQKFYYVQTEEEIMAEKATDDEISVEIKDETKEIAGYECQKAVIFVKSEGEEMMFNIYFTEEIGFESMNFDDPYFKEIPGAMLEFEIETGNGMMKMEAVSVEKKNVSDNDFEVPEGFQKKTSAEIRQMFGGGM